jgi:bla regulator protein blaR1
MNWTEKRGGPNERVQILATQWRVERLGMTLLHFLWQGAIIVTIYAAARKLGARTFGPNGRYFPACAALTAMAIAPVVTWMLLRGPTPESVAVTFTAPMSAARTEPARFISASLPTDAGHAMPGAFLSWVVMFWFIGATAFSLRLLGGWILAERLRSTMVRPFLLNGSGHSIGSKRPFLSPDRSAYSYRDSYRLPPP